MNDYCVYCHTTPSGRKYVGISCDPEKRWRSGKGYEKNYLFERAIEKYGWENIDHKILYSRLTLNEAKEIEKQLIKKWDLTNAKYGLNLSGGGDGILSDSTRDLMSKASKGNKRSLGRALSDESKLKISKSLKKYYKTHDATFQGRQHSEATKQKLRNKIVSNETREKLRINHADVSGNKNPSAKAIVQLTIDGDFVKQYSYATLASKELGLDLSSIIKCCKGKNQTCGGFKWAYAEATK